MPKIEFTQQEIDAYVGGQVTHCYWDCTKKDAEKIKVHADGEKPCLLLETRRPNEDLEVLEYRLCIWEPITQEPVGKVIGSLQKIRRSPDWQPKYAPAEDFPKILEGGDLESYCEVNFPYFRSLTNWMFALYLRKYLIDANSVCLVRPMEMNDKFGYLQPYPTIFASCDVLDMVEDDYCVLRNPLGCTYYDGNKPYQGESFYFVNTVSIYRYDQIAGQQKFSLASAYDHNLGILPAFKVPAMLKDITEGRIYNMSRIQGMICHLNEAVREYSDLQAAKVNHMYPERWEFTQNECSTCHGTGQRRNPLWTHIGCGCEENISCTDCVRGYKVAGPFAKIMVRPINNVEGQTQIPTPPAGYIPRDVEIIKIQGESVEAHIHKALSAVNMEFLSQVPLAQSGVAKEQDRDESRNTVHSVAEDLVSAMDRIYYITAKYRYGIPNASVTPDGVLGPQLYTDEEIADMVPTVPVPERFDLITATQALTEIKMAKDSKANSVLINAMEIEFASKKFSVDPEIRDQLILELELDPLPNIAEDDKNSRLQNSGITQETYVISSNIHEFVIRATEEVKDFAALPYEKQYEKMQEYAQDVIDLQEIQPTTLGDAEPVINGNIQSNQQIPGAVSQPTSGGATVNVAGNSN